MSARTVCWSIAFALIPSVGMGQVGGSLDFGSGLGQAGAGAWLRESRIEPSLRLSHRLGFLHMDGAAAERGGAFAVRRASVEGAIHSPALGPFRLSLAGDYVNDRWEPASPATSASVSGALSAKIGASGVWAGTSRPRNAPLQINFGAWRAFRSLIVSITNQSQAMRVGGLQVVTLWDSIPNDTTGGWNRYQRTDTLGEAMRIERWSDLEARVDWSRRRLSLTAAMSGRRSRDSLRAMSWGRAEAAFQLNSRLAVIAGGGTLPSAAPSGPSTTRFATFGLRLSPAGFLRQPLPTAIRPAATAFSTQLVAPGNYKVTLRVPSARTVEISGDFNQWRPIALREALPNVWEGTIALSPGVHRINVRVDGDAWTAPPGLPATDDDFNGRVGILIIR